MLAGRPEEQLTQSTIAHPTLQGGPMKTLTVSVSLLSILAFAVIFGCAPQTRVDLVYQPSGFRVSPCQKSLSIVTFKDSREKKTVGETQRGLPIYANDSVSNWISRAFYDQLDRSGCTVEYHDRGAMFDTDYVLTGDIKELTVIQMSHTEYDGRLRLNVVVQADGKQVFSKEYVSALTKKTLPSSEIPKETLTELLQGLIQEALSDLRDRLS
jgi:hypothetical protein